MEAKKITKCDLFEFEQIICDLNLEEEIWMITEFPVQVGETHVSILFIFDIILDKNRACGSNNVV